MRWLGTVTALAVSALWVRDAIVFARSTTALKAVGSCATGRSLGHNEGEAHCVMAARGEHELASTGVRHLARLGRVAMVVVPTEEIDHARTGREPQAFLAAPHRSKRDLVEWYRRVHPDTGFWLFDSDSRPTRVPPPSDPARFQQMGSIYWSRDPVMSGLAFLQTCVSLGEELPRIKRGRCFYLVGHGLYVPSQPSELFPPELTEDVALGYVLSMLGQSVNVTPPIDGCDVSQAPINLEAQVRQTRRWMAGAYTATELLGWPCRLRRRVETHATWTHRFVVVSTLLAASAAKAGTVPLVGLCAAWLLRFMFRLFAIRNYLVIVPNHMGAHRCARFALGVGLKPALDALAWIGVRGTLGAHASSTEWTPTAKNKANHE